MKIQVTQEDIDAGVRQSCKDCPIALALRRATGTPVAAVSDRHASIRAKRGKWRGGPLSWQAIEFVKSFDEGKLVEPFEFEINLA